MKIVYNIKSAEELKSFLNHHIEDEKIKKMYDELWKDNSLYVVDKVIEKLYEVYDYDDDYTMYEDLMTVLKVEGFK